MRRLNLSRRFISVVVFLSSWLFVASSFGQSLPDTTWPNYGNDPGGMRYSSAHQIDRGNVGRLRLAWTYRT